MKKSTNASRVTNGSRRFMHGDGRSRNARRLRDLESEYLGPLPSPVPVPPRVRALARRCAVTSLTIEVEEAKLASEDAGFDSDCLLRAVSALSRLEDRLDKAINRERKRRKNGASDDGEDGDGEHATLEEYLASLEAHGVGPVGKLKKRRKPSLERTAP